MMYWFMAKWQLLLVLSIVAAVIVSSFSHWLAGIVVLVVFAFWFLRNMEKWGAVLSETNKQELTKPQDPGQRRPE